MYSAVLALHNILRWVSLILVILLGIPWLRPLLPGLG